MYLQQTIHRTHGVTAFGSHVIGVDPDRATVSFSIVHIADQPEKAYSEIEKLRKATADVLAGYKLPSSQITKSRTSMELAVDGYGKDRKVLGYRAQVDYRVVVHELDTIATLVIELVRAGAKTIESVTYASSKLRDVRARAREGALAAARVKAEGYAKAAGLQLGRVLHIEDVNPDSLRSGGHGPDVDLTAHSDSDDASHGSLRVAGAVLAVWSLV